MAAGTRPSGRYLLIGSELQLLREQRSLTISAAARLSHRSPTWFSTVENGLTAIRSDDLEDILEAYECTDTELAEALIHLARRGRRQGWWHEFTDRVQPAPLDFAALEFDAGAIFALQLQVLPGLLQTPDYAKLMIGGGDGVNTEAARTYADFRIQRQRILHWTNPPKYQVVVGEAALRLVVGGTSVMREQFATLLELIALPHIDFRIVPDAAGPHPAINGSFTIFKFRPAGRLSLVVQSGILPGPPLVTAAEVAVFSVVARDVTEACLSPAQSRDLLLRIASAHE